MAFAFPSCTPIKKRTGGVFHKNGTKKEGGGAGGCVYQTVGPDPFLRHWLLVSR